MKKVSKTKTKIKQIELERDAIVKNLIVKRSIVNVTAPNLLVQNNANARVVIIIK